MLSSDPGKEMIQKIKKTLKGRVDRVIGNALRPEINSNEFLPKFEDLPEMVFAKNLVKVNGKFTYCSNKEELIKALAQLQQQTELGQVYAPEKSIGLLLDMAGIGYSGDPGTLPSIESAITGCESLIARTGSVLVSSGQVKGRKVFGYAPIHIVVAYTSQLVNEISQGLDQLIETYGKLPSFVTTITGPSRTADIEKTLVLGMHGPRELYVFLVNNTL